MLLSTRSLAYLTAIVALTANACSTRDAQPAALPDTALACAGGTVRDAAEASRYSGCETITGDLQVSSSSLTDLSAFRHVRQVTGKLIITNNPRLISVAGLKHLGHAGSVEIRNNPMLAGYPGLLPALAHVDESLVLHSNRGISQREARAVLERVEVLEQVTTNSDASAPRLN